MQPAHFARGLEKKRTHSFVIFNSLMPDTKTQTRWKQEKVENGDMEISDNNNTNEKNKNGCITPDLDQHTLYSQGL